MPAIAQYYRYPGVRSPKSATYTLSHGITPGVASIEMQPQPGFVGLGGTLEFIFGQTRLVFPGMRADLAMVSMTPEGHVQRVSLFDRRWRWHFGEISGCWNKRDDQNRVPPIRVRSPQQLAAACLIEMGEVGYDVSQLPNDTFPAVEWDRDNPAQMLAALCESLGCRIVLTLANTVRICRTGVGLNALPTVDLMQLQSTVNPPERPDSIKFVGGKVRIQHDFFLEAVGLDTDGRIKVIDDLSYTPSEGWEQTDELDMGNVAEGQARDLAKKTVWRWYRVRNLNPDGSKPLKLPGFGEQLLDITQIELEDVQCDTYLDRVVIDELSSVEGPVQPSGPGLPVTAGANDYSRSLPAAVYGIFVDEENDGGNVDSDTTYNGSFTIHKDTLVVEFSKPVYQFGGANEDEYREARLLLRTACTARNAVSGAPLRYEKEVRYPGGNWGTGPRIIKRDEVSLLLAGDYNASSGKLTRVRTNLPECEAQADFWLAAADLEYQTPNPLEGVYRGIKRFSPDGAIQQVTWTVGPEGATTRVSRNNEYSPVVPSYAERRFAEKLRGDAIGATLRQLREQRDEATRKRKK